MPPPLALNHLNLPARDPEALSRWYVRNLGFRANGRFLWSAGTLLVFERGRPIANRRIHLGFRVGSPKVLRAWAATLRRRGVRVPRIHGDSSYAFTRIQDPEGNEIELFHEPVPPD